MAREAAGTGLHRFRKWAAAGMIAVVAAAVATGLRYAPVTSVALLRLNEVFYDTFYRVRPVEDRKNGPVVIIAIDQQSLKIVNENYGQGWPWPRESWGDIATYLDQHCKPRAIVLDLVFTERSRTVGDDDAIFAKALDAVKTPVVLAGSRETFYPPGGEHRLFGDVDVSRSGVIRDYRTSVGGRATLAPAALRAVGVDVKDEPFLLHYHGPHDAIKGPYRYVAAANVLAAAQDPSKAASVGITPEIFRDKIVLIGGTAMGTYDLKSTPVTQQCPGVEVQATAIDNLLGGQRVHLLSPWVAILAGMIGAGVAAFGAVGPRDAGVKLTAVLAAPVMLLFVGAALFAGGTIRWLPLASPLLAVVLAAAMGLAWSYFVEDRERRFILRAFSQCVSPAVADELGRNPQMLALGGLQREMTVMFTDIAGFTDLSELLEEKIEPLLNYYLGEMSPLVYEADGTLDKYIGDAIMSFWNAPLQQPDHAVRACRTALRIHNRELAIQEQCRQRGADCIHTRIGIHTGRMTVGFIGSRQKMNYTVLGDAVNLAARLEPANKLYGTSILITQATADLVADQFVLRKVDVLRVKGKKKPMGVFELVGEKNSDGKSDPAVEQFAAAFAHYQNQKWDAAEALLLELRREHPDDGPCKTLLDRIAHFRQHPPPSDWDGVHIAKEK